MALAVLFVPLAAMGARPATAAPPPEVLLVGDSVMNGMAQTYGATSRAQLGARHTFVLETKGCRRLITTSCRIGDSPAPTNAITVIRSMAGRYRTALVVGAGYNDPTYGSIGLNTAINVVLDEARRQHVPYVIWLTYRVAGPIGVALRRTQRTPPLSRRGRADAGDRGLGTTQCRAAHVVVLR